MGVNVASKSWVYGKARKGAWQCRIVKNLDASRLVQWNNEPSVIVGEPGIDLGALPLLIE